MMDETRLRRRELLTTAIAAGLVGSGHSMSDGMASSVSAAESNGPNALAEENKNPATIFWAQGLSQPPGHMPPISHYGRPHGPDERVQKITASFLAKCGAKSIG